MAFSYRGSEGEMFIGYDGGVGGLRLLIGSGRRLKLPEASAEFVEPGPATCRVFGCNATQKQARVSKILYLTRLGKRRPGSKKEIYTEGAT